MPKISIQKMSNYYLHQKICSYENRQDEGEKQYLDKLIAEEKARIKKFSDELIMATQRFMVEVIEGQVEVDKLDRVYFRQEMWRTFGRGHKHEFHYCRAFDFQYERRSVKGDDGKVRLERYPTNSHKYKGFFISADHEDIGSAERDTMGPLAIVAPAKFTKTDYTFDDYVVIFYYFYRDGIGVAKAAMELSEFSARTSHNRYLEDLYLESINDEVQMKKEAV